MTRPSVIDLAIESLVQLLTLLTFAEFERTRKHKEASKPPWSTWDEKENQSGTVEVSF